MSDVTMGDFEAECDVFLPKEPGFNSGLAFRCSGKKGKPKGYQMEIDRKLPGGEVIVRDAKAREVVSRARYTIDTVKSPNWITVEVDDSLDENGGDRRLGIFRIMKGELHLKQEISNGGQRPTGFQDGFVRFKRPSPKSNTE